MSHRFVSARLSVCFQWLAVRSIFVPILPRNTISSEEWSCSRAEHCHRLRGLFTEPGYSYNTFTLVFFESEFIVEEEVHAFEISIVSFQTCMSLDLVYNNAMKASS